MKVFLAKRGEYLEGEDRVFRRRREKEEEDCKELNRSKGEEGKTFLSNSIFM